MQGGYHEAMIGRMLILAMVLGGIGAVTGLVCIWAMARAIVRPPRMTDGKAAYVLKRLSPGDLGLVFEEIKFDVRDKGHGEKLTLKAWWIAAKEQTQRCVLLVHGYADAKVGAIAWAPMLHSLGFNILAVDLRAHGESQGTYCTAGFLERYDLSQVIDQVKAERPQHTRQIALFGISMGAAVSAATAVMREDIEAVVMESPYTDFCTATVRHATVLGMPGWPFHKVALRLAQWMAEADFSQVQPVNLIPQVRCPVMVIHGQTDPFVLEEDAKEIENAMEAKGGQNENRVYWRIMDAGHVMGICAEPEVYRERVGRFLEEAMRQEDEEAAGASVK
jgi:pimeloyl-ACP methyl ester carboxylesterase